ncbi:MAG: TolC family protein [Nitrospira sp.]|nr:TolC family protein [Nitrospira sp.]
MIIKYNILLLLFFVLAGCSVYSINKEISPLTDTGQGYSIESDDLPITGRWWEEFHDLSLNALVETALVDNLTLKQLHERIIQSEVQKKQSASFLLPAINVNASEEIKWNKRNQQADTEKAGAVLSWELDLWGRLSAARNSAEYEWLASMERLDAVTLLVTAEIAHTYFKIAEQRLKLDLLDRQIEAGETLRELVELRFGYGAASVVDVYQQRQQLAATRAQVPVVKAQMVTLKNSLAVLIGTAPQDLPFVDGYRFSYLSLMPATGIPSDLLCSRPDLRALYNELMAIDYSVAEAVAERFPEVSISANAGFTEKFSAQGRFLTLVLNAVAPVLDWGRRSAEVAKRESRFREKLAEYSEAYLVAIKEVENALWQEHYQWDLLRALKLQEGIARSNLLETRNRYSQGVTDYLPVLTALQSLQRVEHDLILQKRQLMSIRILLHMAIGGGGVINEYSDNSRAASVTENIEEVY